MPLNPACCLSGGWIEDESLLRYQACADFWRRHCYPLPREIAQVVFETWKGPQALLRDINRYLQGGSAGYRSTTAR